MEIGNLSQAERSRLLAGRIDWRDADWQDHCGDPDCEFCHGEIPMGNPNLMTAEDRNIRAELIRLD